MTKILTALLATVFSTGVFANCGKLSIAEMDWASAEFLANLDKVVLEKGFGCEVELVQTSTVAGLSSATEKGTPNVLPELYIQHSRPAVTAAIKENKVAIANPTPYEGIVEGIFVPEYTAKAHPELKTLADILARPDLFPHPEDPSKGGFLTCPAGWGCERANGNLFRAFDMEAKGWKLIQPGSGAAMAGLIAKATARQDNLFFWYWTPTPVMSRAKFTQIDYGVPYNEDMWKNCITTENCANPQPTAWGVPEAVTLVTSDVSANSGINSYLEKRTLKKDVYDIYLVNMDEKQLTGEEAVLYMLEKDPQVLNLWVEQDVATKILNSIK
jgi:glycine betaine/proline transport system substrate-binding protein